MFGTATKLTLVAELITSLIVTLSESKPAFRRAVDESTSRGNNGEVSVNHGTQAKSAAVKVEILDLKDQPVKKIS